MNQEQNPDEICPVVSASFSEGDGKILLLRGRKEFTPGLEHTLSLTIYRQLPFPGVDISYKHLPLVLILLYRKPRINEPDKKFIDYYCFDHKGVCLAHTYEIYKKGENGLYDVIEEGQRNRSIKKLTIEHRDSLSEIIISCYNMGDELKNHPLVVGLRDKTFGEIKEE